MFEKNDITKIEHCEECTVKKQNNKDKNDDIAIIGIACRLPNAKNYNEFSDNLKNGVCSIKEVSNERWDINEFYSSQTQKENKMVTKWLGELENAFDFDNRFFNISSREAINIDPQQRILLEETYHCIEDSAVSMEKLKLEKTSVYVGISTNDYGNYVYSKDTIIDGFANQGNYKCVTANRISYTFGFNGTSIAIDAACASSLVAIDEAKNMLINGDSKYAFAAGVNISPDPSRYISASKAGMISSDGKCKAFDKDANGFVPGEGVAVILMQKLGDAIKDGNHIYGVIKGSAVNHGGKSKSFTEPRVESQKEVILAAYKNAGINPESVSYLEAHGTGTSLGDPIEIEAQKQAFEIYTEKKQFCKVGSLKSNIGHLEAAAGIASVIKVLMMMRAEKIVPSLHVKTLNPIIDFNQTPFSVATELEDWKPLNNDRLLRAGVSSFGFSGVNCHLILEQYKENEEDNKIANAGSLNYPFILSAKTKESLTELVCKWKDYIKTKEFENLSFEDVIKTLCIGREHHNFRVGTIISNKEEIKYKVENTLIDNIGTKGKVDTLTFGKFEIFGFSKKWLNRNEIFDRHLNRLLNELEENITEGKNLVSKFYKKNWDLKYKQVFKLLVQAAFTKTVFELGFVPKYITAYGDNVLASLCASGIFTEMELIKFLISTKEQVDIKVKRPIIPFYDPIRNKMINTIYIKEDYLIFLISKLKEVCKDISNFSDIFERYVNKARILLECQHAFRICINVWKKVLDSLGINIELMLTNENYFKQGEEIEDIHKIILLMSIILSIRKVSSKWNLDVKCDIDNIYFLEILDLIEDRVISIETFVNLIFENNDAVKVATALINKNQNNISSDKAYNILYKFNSGLEEVDDIKNWIYKLISYESDEEEILKSEVYRLNIVLTEDKSNLNFEQELLTLYLKGADISWNKIFPEGTFNKVSLPVTCFNRERFKLTLPTKNKGEEIKALSKEKYGDRELGLIKSEWIKQQIQNNELSKLSNLLVFTYDINLSEAIEQELKNRNISFNNLYSVVFGIEKRKLSDKIFEIRYNKEDDFNDLFEQLSEKDITINTIFYLAQDLNTRKYDIETALSNAFFTPFYIVKNMLKNKVYEKTDILVCYKYDQQENKEYMALTGFARTVALENSLIKIKTIECNCSIGDNIKNIVEEALIEKDTEYSIKLVDGNRYVNRYKQINDKFNSSVSFLKDGGTYIITGGLGKIGFVLAEYISRKVKANIILLGRREPNKDQQQDIQKIMQYGCEVICMQADLSNQKEVTKVIAKIKNKYTNINGIFHLAGIFNNGFIIKKSKQDIDNVFSAKIHGTIYLDKSLKNEHLDFFVMFSSLAADIGKIGQCDYAYANKFLDVFAIKRHELTLKGKRFGKTLAINWPYWEDGGMQISDKDCEYYQSKGIGVLSNNDGIQAFISAMNNNDNVVTVVNGDINKAVQFMDYKTEQKGINHKQVELLNIENLTKELLKEILSDELKINKEKFEEELDFYEYGIDSLIINSFNQKIETLFGNLPKTLLYEYKNLLELTNYFVKYQKEIVSNYFLNINDIDLKQDEVEQEICQDTIPIIEKYNKSENEEFNCDIAIIGIAGKYPDADNIEELWGNLVQGKDCITEIPLTRWDYKAHFNDNIETSTFGDIYCKWGGFINDAYSFDTLFFGISPKEAKTIDPQERIFTEISWAAMEDAGYTKKTLGGKDARVGVFVGVTTSNYQLCSLDEIYKGNKIPGNSMPWSIANRVSYTFNLKGPSIAVDTACSSSLTAIHLACQSLIRGECYTAIAGGVNLYTHYYKYAVLCDKKMLSPSGRSKSFSADGDGFVPGEGVGAIILKPLAKAIEDEDDIYCIIKGSSINHGGKVSGYTVPNPNAQAELIHQVLKSSGISPESISYIEAHGTGTKLGDPIEIRGLVKAFHDYTEKQRFCAVGSIKSNIGHLEAAAGIAGLTKILLQMKYKKLVPSIYSENINPNIDFEHSPFYISQVYKDWDRPVIENNGKFEVVKRRAGLSSFGAGGVNVHIILEEYQPIEEDLIDEEAQHLIVLSAKNKEAVLRYVHNIIEYVRKMKKESMAINLNSLSYTFLTGREKMEERIAVITESTDELLEILEKYLNGKVVKGKLIDKSEAVNIINDSHQSPGSLLEIASRWVLDNDTSLEAYVNRFSIRKRKNSLPTYPFTKEYYSIKTNETDSNNEKEEKILDLLEKLESGDLDIETVDRLTEEMFYD